MNNLLDYKDTEEFKFYYNKIIKGGTTDKNYFLGHENEGDYRVQQMPNEFAAYLCFLRNSLKHSISKYMEIGSCAGGSLRHIYEALNWCDYFSVDNLSYLETQYQKYNFIPLQNDLTTYNGDSTSDLFKEWLKDKGLMYDVVFIDGSHLKKDVISDFYTVKPYVGQFVVFHDYKISIPNVCEVPQAIQELLDSKQIKIYKEFYETEHRPLGIVVCELEVN